MRWGIFLVLFWLLSVHGRRLGNDRSHRRVYETGGEAIPGQYIVEVVNSTAVRHVVKMLLDLHQNVEIVELYEEQFGGFSAKGLTDSSVSFLLNLQEVTVISEDGFVRAVAVQDSAAWNLDTLDGSPGDGNYSYEFTGLDVDVYILDTGIYSAHADFEGRVVSCYDKSGEGCGDRNGHGTHVAGIVGSKTYGVAKKVTIHDYKVLDKNGKGSYTNVIAALNRVVRAKTQFPSRKIIVNLSLSGGFNKALNDAIANAMQMGVVVVAAAGNNDGQDACKYSPGSSSAIVVGSLDRGGGISDFSNRGSCVKSWAPGRGILSLTNSVEQTKRQRGTSMAVPHVAGAAALYMEAGLSPFLLANGRKVSLPLTKVDLDLRPTPEAPSAGPTSNPSNSKNSQTLGSPNSCVAPGADCVASNDECCGGNTCQAAYSMARGLYRSCRTKLTWR